MNRRQILKRAGAATVGTSALAAAASGEEPTEIEIDGERYLTFDDPETVSPQDVETADTCTCDYCDPYLCNFCGPC